MDAIEGVTHRRISDAATSFEALRPLPRLLGAPEERVLLR